MSHQFDSQGRILVELLSLTSSGDKEAFSRLYRLTSPKLYAVALRILKQESLAQECLQDSFLSVWRQAAGYQGHKASPMTWLVTIVRNRSIDLLRKYRYDEVSDDIELEFLTATEESKSRVDHIALEQCLDELKPEHRDCLVMAYFEGLTHPELAERLDTPIGTIKTWIRRSLEQIRQCLEA